MRDCYPGLAKGQRQQSGLQERSETTGRAGSRRGRKMCVECVYSSRKRRTKMEETRQDPKGDGRDRLIARKLSWTGNMKTCERVKDGMLLFLYAGGKRIRCTLAVPSQLHGCANRSNKASALSCRHAKRTRLGRMGDDNCARVRRSSYERD
ncbi:hypothetical protein BCV70DRAFT_5470 [Testicularia cyperi]|uniref:Uncharacterized protein n=1 Tax=Testicularia cyperi TaxID=1882483 RepID=A0A317XZH0_9BASI|nr:hypothetical protein BCV70DRAFT_5470 [Testicularia cyperi]